jgi:thioredoxin-like negative regulator of GroEL
MPADFLPSLPNQEFFESLIVRTSTPAKPPAPLVIVYFTASWCTACKRLDMPALVAKRPDAQWFICDVDENDYTPGYCNVRTIPAFQAISYGKALPLFGNSQTEVVANWLANLPK